jgi:hypothetical protein
VALVIIVVFVAVAAGVYYYYTNYVNVVNVLISISVGGDVPATIPDQGVTVQGNSSVVSSSCSTDAGGKAAHCQIRMPNGGPGNGGPGNGGSASLQVQLSFSSQGCAYPKSAVDSGSLMVSQDFSRSNAFCNPSGTATYFFVLGSGATGYQLPLSPGNAVGEIAFAGSSQSG